MNISKTVINSIENKSDITAEQSIDTEFTLPDYYPEISKILKCMTDINILTKQAREGTAEVGGQVSITLLYSDKENNLNSFSHVCPFTKSVDIEGVCAEDHITATPRADFLNSKATAPRKIEVHGSATLGIGVIKKQYYDIVSAVEAENVFTKCAEITYSEPDLPISKSVFLEDEISIGANKQSISKILRSSAEAKINECKLITNKVIVKGELFVSLLYCPVQSFKPVLVNHVHGFSQIVDCDDLSDNSTCSATATVASFEIHPKTSLDGEVKTVNFESKVNIDIFTDKTVTSSFVTDAFANDYKSDVEICSLPMRSFVEKLQENYVCKKSLEFTDGSVSDVYDLWCKTAINYVTCDGGELLIKGIVLISIIGCDSSGVPVFFERSIDYEYRYTLGTDVDDYKCRPEVTIAAVNHSHNADGGIDVAVELSIKAEIYKTSVIKAVSNIQIDKSITVEKDCDTAITLYFAEGESVWNIAKKYMANPQKICSANGIEDIDDICNKMLLIPNL